jgi:hypothetical protein
MSLTDTISKIWQEKFWNAAGHGLSVDDAEKVANDAVAHLVAKLHRVERAQAPRLPRHSNLAGQRQYAANH